MQKLFTAPLYVQIREESLLHYARDVGQQTSRYPQRQSSRQSFQSAKEPSAKRSMIWWHKTSYIAIRVVELSSEDTTSNKVCSDFLTLAREDGSKPVPASVNIHCKTRKGLKHECSALGVATGERLIEILTQTPRPPTDDS